MQGKVQKKHRAFARARTFAIRVHGQRLCANDTSRRRGRTRHQAACRRLRHRLPCRYSRRQPTCGRERLVEFYLFFFGQDEMQDVGEEEIRQWVGGVADLLAGGSGGVHVDGDDDDEMRGTVVGDLGVGRRGRSRGEREDGGRRRAVRRGGRDRRREATSPPTSPPPRQPPWV
ncbi:unnamed protein product [Urochloa humidicola]